MDKKELRKHIKALKKQYTAEQLEIQSDTIMQKLESHPDFVKANIVMLYYSLPDEVQTAKFIAKWRNHKQIILPTVVGDDIVPVKLEKDTTFAKGDFDIQEPQSEPYTGSYDLIIVPGVAFDSNGNRLGRGRGYYDRFLCNHLNIKKIGICFNFQLVDSIPTEATDIRMDEIISQ